MLLGVFCVAVRFNDLSQKRINLCKILKLSNLLKNLVYLTCI